MALYAFLFGAMLFAPGSGDALSLDEALEALSTSHPLFTKSELEIERARVDLSALEQGEVWNLNLREENLIRGGDPANPFGPKRAYGVSTRVEAQRDFWSNGSRLEVGFDASYLYLQHEDNAGTFSLGAPNLPDVAIPLTRDGLQSALSLQYTYPLLQNPGLLKTLNLKNAGLKVIEMEFRSKEAQELAMLSVSALYVKWWILSEQEKILEKRLELAKENKRVVVRRQRARLAERVDVLRSEQALQRALGGLADCRTRIAGTVAELALLTGISELAKRKPTPIQLESELPTLAADAWVGQTRRIGILENLKARLQLKVEAEEERLKPELAVIMRAGVRREDFRYTDEGSEGEFNPDGFAGVALSIPLDRSFQRSGIESAVIGQRILDEEIRETAVGLTATMARINAELAALDDLIQVKDRQLNVAVQRSREELKMFKLGRTLLNFVIQSQDEVQQAKMERLEVVGRLSQLKVERLALMDLLAND